MDKQQFLKLAEQAYETSEIKQEKILLFRLFQFDFHYDEVERTFTITCPITDLVLNPTGIVHGGFYTFISDTAMGHLNFYFKGIPYVTLELKTSYFKAVSTGKITATARFIKEGYNVSYLECEVTNEENELLCKTTGTFYRFKKKGE